MAVSLDTDSQLNHLEAGVINCETEDDEDEWLFRSVRRYEMLHMYELQQPTQTIEWITNAGICVACQLSNGQSELLQLAVPTALLSAKQSVCKETDFKVIAGGFHDRHIVSLNNVPHSRILISAEKHRNCITLWKTPDLNSEAGSCMIEKSARVENIAPTSHAAAVDATALLAAFGNTTANISVCDVHTLQCIFDTTKVPLASDEVSRLLFADERCLLSCGGSSGAVTMWDLRAGLATWQLQTDKSGSLTHSHTAFTCDRLSHDGPMTTLLLLTSDGRVSVADVRSGCQNHEVLSLNTGQTFSPASHDYMTIRSSFCKELFTISGSGSAVNVYALSSAEKEIKPAFVHTGHRPIAGMAEPTVWTTCWHRGGVPNSVLSAASDGSLHAWQFIPES